MARSPRGRSSIGQAAALALSALASDPSQAAANPAAPQTQQTEPPSNASQDVPEVTEGKLLSVRDNLLGAGVTGKGWTIDGVVKEGATSMVKLHRWNKATNTFEEHKIDAETYKAAKEYKDEQGGMSRSYTPPVLKKADLGRALDPDGVVVPRRFDAATRSYEVVINHETRMLPEALIKALKQGQAGALERIHSHLNITPGGASAQAQMPGQVIGGAVAGAILGKKLATRLGLREKNQEQAPDRDSVPQTAVAQAQNANRAANTPEDRVAQERAKRDQRLRRRPTSAQVEDEDDEDDEQKAQGAVSGRRVVTYQATDKAGESAQVTSEAAPEQASTRLSTTKTTQSPPSAPQVGTRLSLNQSPSPATSSSTAIGPTPEAFAVPSSQVINRPLQTLPLQVGSPSSAGSVAENTPFGSPRREAEKVDRVQAALEQSVARKRRRQEAREKIVGGAAVAGVGATLGPQVVYGSSAPQAVAPALDATTAAVSELLDTEDVSIRRMRELMQAQTRDRGLGLTTPSGGRSMSLSVSSRPLSVSSPSAGSSSSSQALNIQTSSAAAPSAGLGGASQAVRGALASTVALQGAQMAVQAVMGIEGMRREQALRRIQDAITSLEGQAKVATTQLGAVSPPSVPSTTSATTASSPPPQTVAAPRSSSSVSRQLRGEGQEQGRQDLAVLQRGLGTLKNAEQQVASLPPDSSVPMGFHVQISGLDQLLPISPETLLADQMDEAAVQAFGSSFAPARELSPSSMEESAPEQMIVPPSAVTSVRVGAPPVPRRQSSAGIPGQTSPSSFARGSLAPPLASAVQLNAAQARDRGPSGQGPTDARSHMLGEDSSVPGSGANASVPLSAGYTSSSAAQEEPEDVFRTVSQEAASTRKASEQAQATKEQFSGGASGEGAADMDYAGEGADDSARESFSPAQQFAAARQMQAVQGAEQRQLQAATESEATQSGGVTVSSSRKKDSFIQRFTKAKLGFDLIEGCVDGLGFLEFLAESNIALVNDRFFHLSIVPSLKKAGAEERHQRYLRYGIIFLDVMIVLILLMVAVTITVFVVTLMTPLAATTGAISWGLDS